MNDMACPNDAVAAFATLLVDAQAARMLRHAADCPRCRALLVRMCEDEQMLADLRRVGNLPADDVERRRVMRICAEVLSDERANRMR